MNDGVIALNIKKLILQLEIELTNYYITDDWDAGYAAALNSVLVRLKQIVDGF